VRLLLRWFWFRQGYAPLPTCAFSFRPHIFQPHIARITSFRVDEELWHKARVYAVENKITMKELIENLLKAELKENTIKKKLTGEK